MVGADSPQFFKDTEPFIVHPGGALESQLELQEGLITPNRLFYVLHNGERAVDVDASTWRLRVGGDAVERPLTVTYEDIRGMPSRSLVCYLECAGNHRAMFDLLGGSGRGEPAVGHRRRRQRRTDRRAAGARAGRGGDRPQRRERPARGPRHHRTQRRIPGINPTDAAVNDNMELGVLIESTTTATQLHRHFQQLITDGVLVRAR